MQSLQFDSIGQPSVVLTLRDEPIPTPSAGQAVVKVAARPINPSDVLFVQGLYGQRPKFPASLAGFEGVGTIEAAGDGGPYPVGTRVAFVSTGTWQDYCLADYRSMFPVPNGVSDEDACQFIINPLTAWAMLHDSGLKEGQFLLHTAANSTLGHVVIQLAKKHGIKVIATVRSDDQAEVLLKLGAFAVINTAKENLTRRVFELTEKKGVPFCFESVGGEIGAQAIASLAFGGKLFAYGLLSLENVTLDYGLILFKCLTIRGFWLTEWLRRGDLKTVGEAVSELFEMLSTKTLLLPVAGRYPLARYAEALKHAETAGRNGKVLFV